MGIRHNLRTASAARSDALARDLRDVRGRIGIRARLLSIVLISSVTLLAIGGGAAVYLVDDARSSTEWADLASSTTGPAILMISAFEEERRLSLLRLAGDEDAAAQLATARQQSDAALVALEAKGDAATELNPNNSAADIEGYNRLFEMVPTLRAGIDALRVPADQVFTFFTQVIGTIIAASVLAARVAPDAEIAVELGYGVEVLRAAEALSQADTLGSVALTTGELTEPQLLEFSRRVGEFRDQVAYAATVLKGKRLDQLNAITAGPAWQRVTAMQDAVVLRGAVTDGAKPKTALPLDLAGWQSATAQVNSALQQLWEDQSRDAHAVAKQRGTDATRDALLGGGAVLLVATVAFLLALLLANRFIGRMRRLRRHTLELADERMPELIRRAGSGAAVDAERDAARLDFGTDELGQVADAFNRAHGAAVAAAVAEAKTRTGINAVFLNIAHRSQVVVHRQLALLDRAEREETDADQLELLFQLDHLATRARRNAENLVILGGEQPGRRWRNPVLLIDLIRGAVAESLDYTRISTGRIPEVRIASKAVADVIHLLAELMDNATAFSPPESPVTVSAVVVGRGVAIEIIDQGLGMSEAEFAERNAMLADPPDFSVATLSSDTRLGLFVVAKLAGRHGLSVRLTESDYGGVRAVVLVPHPVLEAARPVDAGVDGIPEVIAVPEVIAPLGTSVDMRRLAEITMPPMPPLRESWPGSLPMSPGTVHRAVDTAPSTASPARPLPSRDDRPELPRRHRHSGPKANTDPVAPAPPRQRTADEARDLMSAIAKGTRQGRQAHPDTGRTPNE
ncbi:MULTISPECIES: nitrate- and nitrite sensing domain-containing protein [unclassified Nocardia]|uniref:sensor histidine kinase n=1 Tax=unclassified Nocardia TaxID=2637762 RepID=UPI0024A8038B|nr:MULTISPECIES: nitrate- and nitrite sensing domain-containing protein [unclassified Nocardia]